ncbi:MAG: LysR family transcriptional regulator [Alphaproteobacteria bacterium]
MDWDKLRIFHAVAESGSLTGAGKALSLSQPAVSRQIATLEETLGVGLFRRHARGLVLTEQGEILYETTKDIFHRLSVVKGQLGDTRKRLEGPLTITVSEFIASTWLAPRLVQFREAYPDIQLTILVDDKILKINLKEADAALRLSKPTESDLVHRHLASIHFHIGGSKSYFEKYGHPKTVSELKNHRLIGVPENITWPFGNPNWLFEVAGVNQRSNNLMMTNSMQAIHQAVKTGAGLAVLPDYLIAGDPGLEAVLPKLERPPVDLYFIYAEERRHSRRLTAFRDFLLENIQGTHFASGF